MGANWSKFHLAKDGDTDTVVAMIDAGDSIEQITDDKYGVTALHVSAHYGQVSVIQALLSRGAQIEQEDKDGQTPLILAAWRGHQEVVSLLLVAGANINHENNYGNTALGLAAMEGHQEVVTMLLENAAEKDAKN